MNPVQISDIRPCYGYLDNIISSMTEGVIENRENSVANVINKVIASTEKMSIESGEIAVNIGCEIKDYHIIDDIHRANRLLNDKNTDWKIINRNYHCENLFSCNKNIIDTIIAVKVYRLVLHKFEYESNTYLKGNIQRILDKESNSGQKLYDSFKKYYNELLYYEDFQYYHKRSLKYFLSLYDYHAEEILKDIQAFRKNVENNLENAPILWITWYLYEQLGGNFAYLSHDGIIDISEYITLMETNCGTNKNFNCIYEMTDKEVLDIVKALSNMPNEVTVIIDYKKYEIIMSLEANANFVKICNSATKNAKSYDIFIDDVQCILSKRMTYETSVVYMLDSFDYNVTLKKILGLEIAYVTI